MTKKKYTALMIVTAVLTLTFLIALATNIAPWLRGPKYWRWPYAIPGTFLRLWLPALLLACYIAVAQWLHGRPLTRRTIVLVLLLSALMTPAIQLALLYMDHPDPRSQLFYRIVSEHANGFFNVGAVVTDRYDFLRYYARRMLSWYPTHPERHPPGLPVLFSLARQFFDATPGLTQRLNEIYRPYQCHNVPLMNLPDGAIASATLQMALPFALGLVALPLYLLGRDLYDRATAIRAVLMWPLMPGIALWVPFWTTLYAFFTVLALLLFHYGLSKHRTLFFYLSGLTISVSSFLSFGNLAILSFLGAYALVWWIATSSRPKWHWLVRSALLFVLGTATFWALIWFRYRLSFFAVWREGMGKHLEMDRIGWFWILYHLYDFFVFSVSVPILIFWIARTGAAIRGIRSGRKQIDVMALSFFLGLLVLDLSGAARGEVARVWAFLVPLPLLVAVSRLPRRRALFIVLIALFSLHLFVANIFIRFIGTDLTDPPAPPPTVVQSADRDAQIATWEGEISLLFAQTPATVTRGQSLTVRTTWMTSRQVNRPYTVFVHLYDRSGNLATQWDTMPLQGRWPTTCWQPGKNFEDSYTMTVPESSEAGNYRVYLGMYWLPTGERLSLSGQNATTIDLGTVQVTATSEN
jgi:hypothetical protein